MRLLHHFFAACALSISVAVALPAQSTSRPPVVALGAANADSGEPFSRVSAVVELSGDRVLVADERDNRLVSIEFTAGAARQLGRTGSGPGEYRLVSGLYARPGGGAWLNDFAQRRLLPIRSDGAFENPVPVPVSMTIRQVDERGVLYGEAFLPRERMQRADSMWVVRWDPATTTVDTLMKYDAGVTKWIIPRGAPRPVNPPIDTWVALANGDILVLEAERYRAVVYRDGRAVRSASIPWEPVPVTAAEREAFLRAASATPPRQLGQRGAPMRDSGPAPEYDFPEHYPPFGGKGGGGIYAYVAPTGHVWIERLRASTDSIPRYDVLDASSLTVVGVVTMPPRSALVGFGRGTVYTVRRDADDVEWLGRHPYPVLAGR
ncbi:MAG TPA: hypothetical protein VF178_01240 [Gemmatimonadaceae bacterium]